MGDMIDVRAGDGQPLKAYLATPDGAPKAGMLILQEVFGITDHIKRVTDGYAADGYLAIAPSLFDRVAPGVVLDYTEVERGREIMMRLDREQTILDMAAAIDQAQRAGAVGAVGYCWGGAMADLAACRLPVTAAVSYYGRATVEWLDLSPACPVLYHFGADDPLIPPEMVAQIRTARPDGAFHIYEDAGHGFNCDDRPDYRPDSAQLARERTLAFFDEYL